MVIMIIKSGNITQKYVLKKLLIISKNVKSYILMDWQWSKSTYKFL